MNRTAIVLGISSMAFLLQASVFARQALAEGVHEHTIVFVCEHGSAKSVIAARRFNDLANKDGLPYRAIARGVNPGKEIPRHVKNGRAAEDLDIRGWQPKRFSEGDALKSARYHAGMSVADGQIDCDAQASAVDRFAVPERGVPKCKPDDR